MPRYSSIPERFWTKVEFTDTCWLWKRGLATAGYGKFWDGAQTIYAHRWAYEFCVGSIPTGLTIDHLCRVRCCIYPWHMEPVTAGENVRRGISANALKTHCPQGHPYDEENTYPYRGGRMCRTCHNAKRNPPRECRNGEPMGAEKVLR